MHRAVAATKTYNVRTFHFWYTAFIHSKNKMSQMTHIQKRIIATEKKHYRVSLRFNKSY